MLVSIVVMMFTTVPVVKAETLQQLLDKKAKLEAEAKRSQQVIDQKKKEALTIQDTIEDISGDISYTQNRISNTENQISVTNNVLGELDLNIKVSTEQLNELQKRLRSAYVGLYELSQTSTLELLFQGDSLSEMVSHAQYVQTIQDGLQKDIVNMNAILADLDAKKKESEAQKASLVGLNTKLSSERTALSRQKNEKDRLLSVTQGQQQQYEAYLAEIKQEATQVSEEIYVLRSKLKDSITTGGTGGYPYANSTPDVPDPWGFLTRECTSYAAWKFNAMGNPWYRGSGPAGYGNASNWGALASRQGYAMGSSPRAGAIIFWGAGPYTSPYGHVAYVEAVNGDGTIDISEYNWVRFAYSYRSRITPSNYGNYTYIYP